MIVPARSSEGRAIECVLKASAGIGRGSLYTIMEDAGSFFLGVVK